MLHPVLLAALIDSALAHDKDVFDIREDAHRIVKDALQHNYELYPEERAVLLSSYQPRALDQIKSDLSILRDAASHLLRLLRYAERVKAHVPAEVLDDDATLLGACGYTAGVSQLQDNTSSQLAILAITIVHKYERYLSTLTGNNHCPSTSTANHDARSQTMHYSLVSLLSVHETIAKAIHEVEAQFTALEQHNVSCAIALSIIRTIPSEILLHIFAFVHVGEAFFPSVHSRHQRVHFSWDGRIVVGRVCRKWRELVNGHSALWRDITFPPHDFCYLAQAEDMLSYQLSRVRYGHINAIVPMYNRESSLGKLFLSWAPRVARLKIEDRFETHYRGSWIFDLPRPLPLLRSVELVMHHNPTLSNQITAFAHAPLLQTFTSILFFGNYYRRPIPFIPLPYANLVEFNTAWYLNFEWHTVVGFSNFFLCPLYEGKRLKTYRQWGCELGYRPSVEVAERRHQQDTLVKLVTCSSTILDAIACPLLETLSVGNVEGDGTYQVPEGRKFRNRTPQSAAFLIKSTAAFLSASHCPLNSLELKSVTFNHNFITILRSTPSLETLNATATAFSAEEDDTLSEFFSLLREDDHGEFPFLPQLRSLSFTVNLCLNYPRWRRGLTKFYFANNSLFDAVIARSNAFQVFSLIIKAQEPFWALNYKEVMRLRELECVKELRCVNLHGRTMY